MQTATRNLTVIFLGLGYDTPHQIKVERCAVNRVGKQQRKTFYISVEDNAVYQRLLDSEQSGDLKVGETILVTIMQAWDEHDDRILLTDFLLSTTLVPQTGAFAKPG
jgi:hypothetical protein